MNRNPFSDKEIDNRLGRFRNILASQELDAAILSSPENIFYFTGLNHWGYFAPHMLVVPLAGEPVLITRRMERFTIERLVRSATFRGHDDSETAADETARVLADLKLQGKRIGVEAWSSGLSAGLMQSLRELHDARWSDISGKVDTMRHVKSAEEQALMRDAASVSNAATAAAVAAIGEDVPEREVAAECLAAMTRAGGEPPGFGPFIRSRAQLGEEHVTWGAGNFVRDDAVFLEIAGCVGRYHAPNGRLVRLGAMPDRDLAMAELAQRAFDNILANLTPGRKAREVYAAWQAVVDEAGLPHYRRHHCGYLVGVAFPPSWTGGNSVTGLRHDSEVTIETGMAFHIMSWLMGTGQGDFFLSNCVLLGDNGAEVLTTTPHVQTR